MTKPREEEQVTSSRMPTKVSVIVPVRDGEATLAEQLYALSTQTYNGNWELIISDNGSSDGTIEVAKSWSDRFPEVCIVDASRKNGSPFARNVGIAAATGDFLCFCDADDVVSQEWLSALVATAADFDVVTGPLEVEALNFEKALAGRDSREDPDAERIAFAPSGNFGIWADAMRELGGFNEDYPKAHDEELGIRVRRSGLKIGWSPKAVVHYRYRSTAIGIMRQSFRSGRASQQLWIDYPTDRVPPESLLRRSLWLFVRLPYLFWKTRRLLWCRRFAESVGIGVGKLRHRLRRRRLGLEVFSRRNRPLGHTSDGTEDKNSGP